jgi:hypothetical protein
MIRALHQILLCRTRPARNFACIGKGRDALRVLVRKADRKRQPGRPGHRLDDNIEIDLKEK